MTPPGDPGTLDDVSVTRRALYALIQPGWMHLATLFPVLALACAWPLIRLLHFWGMLLILAATATWLTWFLVKARGVRALPVRPVPVRFFSRRVFRGVLALMVAGLATVLAYWAVLAVVVDPTVALGWTGAGMLFLIPFILAVPAIGWRLDPTGVDSSALRDLPDQPATLDPLIASREPLAVCATLAYVGQLGDDLLARTLGISTYDVSRVSAELVRAQYIYVQPDGPRWWLGLTPAGRAAYRRHLRALGA